MPRLKRRHHPNAQLTYTAAQGLFELPSCYVTIPAPGDVPSVALAPFYQLQHPPSPSSTADPSHLGNVALTSRIRNICLEPNCTKQARISMERGTYQYCKTHLRAHGLTPRENTQTPMCHHPGCPKMAVQCKDGGRLYCVAHMRLMGLEPSLPGCQHPDCSKKAQPSEEGPRQYCNCHMRQYGLHPKAYQAPCAHPGCSERARRDFKGGHFCKAHAMERGIHALANRCQEPGCERRALKSVEEKQRTYCAIHQVQHGLTRKQRLCQHPGCLSPAEASSEETKWTYCRDHMAQYGLTPKHCQCQHPGCQSRARASSTDARAVYCGRHMGQYGLTPAKGSKPAS